MVHPRAGPGEPVETRTGRAFPGDRDSGKLHFLSLDPRVQRGNFLHGSAARVGAPKEKNPA
jgi:hypothetical protein